MFFLMLRCDLNEITKTKTGRNLIGPQKRNFIQKLRKLEYYKEGRSKKNELKAFETAGNRSFLA